MIAALLVAGLATADIPPPSPPDTKCVLRHQFRDIASYGELPPSLKSFLKTHLRPETQTDKALMADRGRYFAVTDVGPGLHRRFIRAGANKTNWFIWFERGGFGYDKWVVLGGFDLRGNPLVSLHVRTAKETNLCALTDWAIDNTVFDAEPW